MFGRKKKPGIILVAEFRENLVMLEDSLSKERADLVRAEFNVAHHRAQISYYEARRQAYIDALTQAEKDEDERKESESLAKGTARQRGSDQRRTDERPGAVAEGAQRSWGESVHPPFRHA